MRKAITILAGLVILALGGYYVWLSTQINESPVIAILLLIAGSLFVFSGIRTKAA